ncbi:MAG TPA: pyridoxamine 5'-phosphate oxidase family protein [Ornithinimicrobium sp.]|nr:pyridoxamine 5'-phosphate oxidase family protein [Ornithinimicrobium sp.]
MSEQRSTPILSEDECWERLRRLEFGRMAYHLADEVHITPLNYAVDGERIVFRTSEGSKLLGVAMNEDVAFEVDEILEDEERAWSVIARGKARILEGDDARDADNLRLRPWVSSAKFNVVGITVEEVSGRDFHLARPWRHMLPPED